MLLHRWIACLEGAQRATAVQAADKGELATCLETVFGALDVVRPVVDAAVAVRAGPVSCACRAPVGLCPDTLPPPVCWRLCLCAVCLCGQWTPASTYRSNGLKCQTWP